MIGKKPRNQKITKYLTQCIMHLTWEDAKTACVNSGSLIMPVNPPIGDGGPADTVLFRGMLGGSFIITISTAKRKRQARKAAP